MYIYIYTHILHVIIYSADVAGPLLLRANLSIHPLIPLPVYVKPLDLSPSEATIATTTTATRT